MNAKVLSSLSAALIVASWVSPAMAEPESPELDWSAAIGTGHAAGTIETSHYRTDSAEPNSRSDTLFSASLDREHWHGNSSNLPFHRP